MEYYIEMYKKIVSMIDSTNKDIVSIKEEISEYHKKIDLFDKEISDRRDDIVYELKSLDEKEKSYNSSLNSLLRCKKDSIKSICIILLSSLLTLVYFYFGNVIGNICLVSFLAISLPCGLNIIGNFIDSLFIKKKISKFDIQSNNRMINLLEKKLNNIDISLKGVYNDRKIINQRIDDLYSEMTEKKRDIKFFEEEKRRIEKEIIDYIREMAVLSCDKDIEGQIFMDDVLKKIRKL